MLKAVIRKSVVDNDGFGLRERDHFQAQASLPPAAPRAWAYRWSHEKVDAFMKWLKEMEEKSILEIVHRPGTLRPEGEPWTNLYVRSAYQRGLSMAMARVRERSIQMGSLLGLGEADFPPSFLPTGRAISAIMAQPFHADRLALAYTRVFDELKGVSAAMDQQISRELTKGIAQGLNPRQIGGIIADRVEKIGATRGRLIARTETIHIHAQASLNEYYSVEQNTGEVVLIQWSATMDSRTRDTHMERHNRVYTKEEAYALIGEPNCRCALLPYIPAIQGVPDKASDAAMAICQREANKELAKVKAPPAQPAREKEPPMRSIGRMSNCLVRGVTANLYINDRPDTCKDYYRSGGKWYMLGQEVSQEIAERLKKMGIPPAWKQVVVSADPSAKIQAMGLDRAGRWQYRYSAEHIEEAARKKFDRIKLFSRDIEGMRKSIADGIASGDPRAYLAYMEDKTAIRIGSDTDFKAKVKAYGLTTLEGRHVSVQGEKVILDFIAKEGIPAHYEIEDSVLARWLGERKASLSSDDLPIFPDVSASKFNKYLKDIAGGKDYSAKDFRTYHASVMAKEELSKYAGKELTKAEVKQIVKEVSTKVSQFLRNTPAMAIKSYIDPMVWEVIGGLPK